MYVSSTASVELVILTLYCIDNMYSSTKLVVDMLILDILSTYFETILFVFCLASNQECKLQLLLFLPAQRNFEGNKIMRT